MKTAKVNLFQFVENSLKNPRYELFSPCGRGKVIEDLFSFERQKLSNPLLDVYFYKIIDANETIDIFNTIKETAISAAYEFPCNLGLKPFWEEENFKYNINNSKVNFYFPDEAMEVIEEIENLKKYSDFASFNKDKLNYYLRDVYISHVVVNHKNN